MNNYQKKVTSDKLIFNYGKHAVAFNSIKYIESFAGNYSMIRLDDKGYICSSFTLKHYTSRLEGVYDFYLARKGLLLNLKFVDEIIEEKGAKLVRLSTGEVFKLSRRIGARLVDYLRENTD
ncbi:MAG: hypothetical protein IPH28_25510 [Cytophagaceae bacterium]|nr:hypothetical protein [Cytophagaceae bacterium]MBK9936539.1 hypothetical protein [Cytophagaceae bacterium]MBL0300293.1 hypothetical protein [Cytophagaceae bacterium]MBL0327224.1 hypothetical protein [Cytophagaceae bacterium]